MAVFDVVPNACGGNGIGDGWTIFGFDTARRKACGGTGGGGLGCGVCLVCVFAGVLVMLLVR